jgi:hypothetical protein
MKILKKIEVGQIGHTYVSSWKSDNEVELHVGDDVVTFSMTEEVMGQLHKKLGDKLTQLATERLEAAKQLSQEEASDDE